MQEYDGQTMNKPVTLKPAGRQPGRRQAVRSLAAGLVLLAGCQSGKPKAPAPAPEPPKVAYSQEHDPEIKAIFELARENKWEEAERRAGALRDLAPGDTGVERLHAWVVKQSKLIRERALEDEIRSIDAKNSTFNPTVKSLLTEEKDRGLPPRKDVRDAVEQIETTPYVPENYGRVIQKKGVLFDLKSESGRMARMLEQEVNLTLDNIALENLLLNLGQTAGVNFVADKALPALQQKLSVNLNQVKLGEFLRYLSRNYEIQFQVGDDLVWVVDAKDPKRVLEETRVYRLRKGFILPAQFGPSEITQVTTTTPQNVRTVTETQKVNRFVNDGAPEAPALETAIKEFFKGSKYLIDYERNLIVAQGTLEQLDVLERLIEEFDQPVQQVLIEARFITVSQAAFLELGAQWESGRDTLTAGQRTATDFTGLAASRVGLGLQESFTNILGRASLSATLSALEQSGESQTLSAPRITLVNNRPARISDGKIQYYYEEYQVKQQVLERRSSSQLVPSGKPSKITSGASLDVMASVGGDGRSIMLALKPEVNQEVQLVPFATITDVDDTGRVVSTFDIKLPESRTQSLSTRVVVQSGQTVVMGGVLEREQTTFVESVPILGRIPIIGAAFRKRTEVDKPRYLLVFVTATLLSDTGEFIEHDEPVVIPRSGGGEAK